MESLVLNTSILTPRGFRPRINGPREGVPTAPLRLWGANDIAALREAPFVRVTDGAHGATGAGQGLEGVVRDVDRHVLTTVMALALAGVPVTGHGLPMPVRARLDPALLEIIDGIGPDTAADPAERELLSLALRRRAWQVAGYRPPAAQPPAVLALLPDELPLSLLADLEAQVAPGVTVRVRHRGDGEDVEQIVREERERGAVYVTRPSPHLRYGPHHLADLVHALEHSGARVAFSPRRFLRWEGAWLEDGSGSIESAADGGLPGGSLWYAVDGATEPVAGGAGYAVHGTGAVPVGARAAEDAGLVPLRMHDGLPRVLSWLDAGDQVPEPSPTGVGSSGAGASYFARPSGRPDLARSSVTAADS